MEEREHRSASRVGGVNTHPHTLTPPMTSQRRRHDTGSLAGSASVTTSCAGKEARPGVDEEECL